MFPLKDNIPTDRFPVVTVVLIVLNVLFYFLLQPKTGIDLSGQSLDPREIYDYAAVPCTITGEGACRVPPGDLPAAATLFTAMFSHAGLLHLGGNMLFLWIFGNNVEDSMGRGRFVAFYLICGLAAAAAHVLVEPNSPVPTVGASGAISGVLGGYLLLYPKVRVRTFFPPFFLFHVPAWVILVFWFVQQVVAGLPQLSRMRPDVSAGVAVWAHIGGFVAGALLVKLFASPGRVARRNTAGDAQAAFQPTG